MKTPLLFLALSVFAAGQTAYNPFTKKLDLTGAGAVSGLAIEGFDCSGTTDINCTENGSVLPTLGGNNAYSGTTAHTPSAAQTIDDAADTIAANATQVQVSCSSAITLTSAPTIADGSNGQVVTIINTGSNNCIVQDQDTLASSNLQLSAASVTIAPKQSLTLRFNSAIGDWVQATQISATEIQERVEGGTLITCSPTAAGVECGVTNAGMRTSSGLASALPGSCTIPGAEFYHAEDTDAMYKCKANLTYGLVGGGATESYQRLCGWGTESGITATSNTSSVPNVTPCTVAAGTIAASDRVECEFTISRAVTSTADSMGFIAAYVVNSTAVQDYHSATANSNTYGYKLSLVISNPSTSTQTMISTGVSTLNNNWVSNSGINGVVRTINTATTDLTIEPRVWGSSFTDDTIRFDGGSCYLRKAD